jgi:predicted GIY-YIG superfamily endonuclease
MILEKTAVKAALPSVWFKVYHIRLKGHFDTDYGYIGVTKSELKDRLRKHRSGETLISSVLRETPKDQIEIVELYRFTDKEEALEHEFMLRPMMNMGWNRFAGGNIGTTLYCPKCKKPLKGRANDNALCADCHDTRFKGNRYKLMDPNGREYYPDSLREFCKEHDLQSSHIIEVAQGKKMQHKGWTATIIEGRR